MNSSDGKVIVAIATPLEPELVARIAACDGGLEVRWEPDLLPPIRFSFDHRGSDGFQRTAEQEVRWQQLLNDAEVVFGLPGESAQGLAELVRGHPGLRWVQATAGGVGEQVRGARLTDLERDRVLITRAAGVHAGPLAEFAMFGILAFAKQLPRLIIDRHARHWDDRPVSDLAGKFLLVVGLGSVGAEVARLGHAFGMHVSGVNQTGRGRVPGVERIRRPRFLGDLLPSAHAVVLALPLTEQTVGMIGT